MLPEPAPGTGLRVVRLCSVFEPPAAALRGKGARFDPVGGMQGHTAALTRGLDRRGVEQTVVTTRPPPSPARHPFGERSRVVRLGLPMRSFRQLYSLPAAVAVPALAAGADVVHAHLGEDLMVVPIARSAARLHRIPLVLTIHCSLRHTLAVTDTRSAALKRVGGPIEAWGVRRADAVITLTGRLAATLEAEGVSRAKLHVIPPGVDRVLFAGPFLRPLPQLRGPRVVFVGRLVQSKGVHVLLEAFGRLRRSDATLVLVGDGPERAALQRAAARAGLGQRVHVTGFLPYDHIPPYMATGDVLALPTLFEELGRVILEAMQAGVPVVASRVGGIPEVVEHERTGLLVPPGNPAALAAALDRLLDDPSLRRRLAASARDRSSGFDWDVVAERTLAVYEEVLGRRLPRAPVERLLATRSAR